MMDTAEKQNCPSENPGIRAGHVEQGTDKPGEHQRNDANGTSN